MPEVIRCKLCHQDGPAAQAHIEPDSFFSSVKNAKGQISAIDLDAPQRDHVFQSGPWDRTILCRACEERFSPLDLYGSQFFRDEAFTLKRETKHFGDVLIAEGVDQEKLKRFLLFLAWRIGVSQRPSYKAIDLGDRIDGLSTLLLSDQTIKPHLFPVVMKRYEGVAIIVRDGWNFPLLARDIHLNPGIMKQGGGRRVLQAYLADYVVYIAIDDVAPNEFWATVALGATTEPVIFVKQFCKSRELMFIKQKLVAAKG